MFQSPSQNLSLNWSTLGTYIPNIELWWNNQTTKISTGCKSNTCGNSFRLIYIKQKRDSMHHRSHQYLWKRWQTVFSIGVTLTQHFWIGLRHWINNSIFQNISDVSLLYQCYIVVSMLYCNDWHLVEPHGQAELVLKSFCIVAMRFCASWLLQPVFQ